MQIDQWVRSRNRTGTLADVARRMLASGKRYEEAEQRLRHAFVLEALIQCDGNQDQAASLLGVHRNTIGRAVKALGMKSGDVRSIAKQLRENVCGN